MQVKIEIAAIFYFIFGILISIIGILFIRALNRIEDDIKDLFGKVNVLRSDHDQLKGSHDAFTCDGKHEP